MRVEQNYDFRKELCRIHRRVCNWKSRTPQNDELVLEDGLTISCSTQGQVARTALRRIAPPKASLPPRTGPFACLLAPECPARSLSTAR